MTYKGIIDNMDVTGEELSALIDGLPSWRRDEALRYKFEGGRRECAMSYLLLCDMLREHFGITEQPAFDRGQHGKPMLRFKDGQRDVFFNISHCKNAVACIVSDEGEVGIDVECLGRYKPSLAEYCMNSEEVQSINDAEDSDLFFTRLWTQKEAFLKLTGDGITDDMKVILLSPEAKAAHLDTSVNMEKGYVCTTAQNVNTQHTR